VVDIWDLKCPVVLLPHLVAPSEAPSEAPSVVPLEALSAEVKWEVWVVLLLVLWVGLDLVVVAVVHHRLAHQCPNCVAVCMSSTLALLGTTILH